jgi:hypothetical protein
MMDRCVGDIREQWLCVLQELTKECLRYLLALFLDYVILDIRNVQSSRSRSSTGAIAVFFLVEFFDDFLSEAREHPAITSHSTDSLSVQFVGSMLRQDFLHRARSVFIENLLVRFILEQRKHRYSGFIEES